MSKWRFYEIGNHFRFSHYHDQVRVASVLLESGAQPNATNKIGQTALIYAVINITVLIIIIIIIIIS